MINVIPGRSYHANGTIPNTAAFSPVGALPLVKVNGVWTPEQTPNINQGAFGNIAIGGNLSVYATTAGKFPLVYWVCVSSSVAGRITLFQAGWTVEFIVGANAPVSVSFPRPIALSVGANLIVLTNNTGAIANLACDILLAEY